MAAVIVGGCGGGDDVKGAAGCSPQQATHELAYRAEAVPRQAVTPAALDETVRLLCERARQASASVDVRRVGADQVAIRSASRLSPPLRSSIAAPDRLAFYDWEPNLTPPNQEAPVLALKAASTIAAKQSARAEPDDVPVEGPSPAVRRRFGADTRAIERYYDRQNDVFAPAGAPRGIVILRDEARTHAGASLGYWVLEDDSVLTSADILNPKQGFDPQTNEPLVYFDFTPHGRRAFALVTKREAERGAQVTVPPGADPAASYQRFAIALDRKIVSLATVNYRELPEGISGSTGAQINGGQSITDAQNLARNLSENPLPLDLKLLSDR